MIFLEFEKLVAKRRNLLALLPYRPNQSKAGLLHARIVEALYYFQRNAALTFHHYLLPRVGPGAVSKWLSV